MIHSEIRTIPVFDYLFKREDTSTFTPPPIGTPKPKPAATKTTRKTVVKRPK
jgi:hypothetical protein